MRQRMRLRRVVEVEHLDGLDLDLFDRRLDDLAAVRLLVEALAVDLDGRRHRHLLHDVAEEARQRPPRPPRAWSVRPVSRQLAR